MFSAFFSCFLLFSAVFSCFLLFFCCFLLFSAVFSLHFAVFGCFQLFPAVFSCFFLYILLFSAVFNSSILEIIPLFPAILPYFITFCCSLFFLPPHLDAFLCFLPSLLVSAILLFLLVFANFSLFLLVCVQYREVFNLIELSYFPPSRKKAKRRGYAPPGNAAANQKFAGPTERAFLLH